MLAPVRESLRTGVSLEWNRVHNLADFAYFDHSVHVAKGVACLTCHGHVDQMPLIYKSASLQMEWCLECHRQPGKFLSPREAIFRMEDPAPGAARPTGAELIKEYRVHTRTDCSACHR